MGIIHRLNPNAAMVKFGAAKGHWPGNSVLITTYLSISITMIMGIIVVFVIAILVITIAIHSAVERPAGI